MSEVYPAANEGELARLYNRLVRGGTCAEVARALDLGASLVLSESEAGSGGRDKETILADACEALLGAIFLEAGYDKARAVVRTHWGAQARGLAGAEAADAKSALQEWAQGQGLDLPHYVEVERRARTTRRASPPRCASRAASPRAARAPASAPPSRPPPPRCWRARACGDEAQMS